MPVTTHYWYVHITEGNDSAIFTRVGNDTVFVLGPNFEHQRIRGVSGVDTLTLPWVTLRGRRFVVADRLRRLAGDLISYGIDQGVSDGNLCMAQLNHTYHDNILEVSFGMGYTATELTPLFKGRESQANFAFDNLPSFMEGLMDSIPGAPFDGHRLSSLCGNCKWKNPHPDAYQISRSGGLQYLCLEDHRSPILQSVKGSYKVIDACEDYTLLERPTRFERTPVI